MELMAGPADDGGLRWRAVAVESSGSDVAVPATRAKSTTTERKLAAEKAELKAGCTPG